MASVGSGSVWCRGRSFHRGLGISLGNSKGGYHKKWLKGGERVDYMSSKSVVEPSSPTNSPFLVWGFLQPKCADFWAILGHLGRVADILWCYRPPNCSFTRENLASWSACHSFYFPPFQGIKSLPHLQPEDGHIRCVPRGSAREGMIWWIHIHLVCCGTCTCVQTNIYHHTPLPLGCQYLHAIALGSTLLVPSFADTWPFQMQILKPQPTNGGPVHGRQVRRCPLKSAHVWVQSKAIFFLPRTAPKPLQNSHHFLVKFVGVKRRCMG